MVMGSRKKMNVRRRIRESVRLFPDPKSILSILLQVRLCYFTTVSKMSQTACICIIVITPCNGGEAFQRIVVFQPYF